jgi:micrococcal nuclease
VQSYLEKINQSEDSNYGKYLFERLESDVGIERSVLYRMRNFYKTYPKLPADDEKLNWNHYQILTGIKDENRRQYLEDLTREENLTAEKLRKKIKKMRKPQVVEPEKIEVKKLKFNRGKLFCYKLIDVAELDGTCVDCGFGIFHQLEKNLPKDAKIIETIKSGEEFLAKKSGAKSTNLNAYKAYLRKVVDGDTIHVVLDLGFKIFHEEILRLRQIDAPEFSSAAGRKSANALKKILQNLPFLIVKTHKTDIYGRYLADVFLPDADKNFSAEEVVEKGEYLSQILLDRKLAIPFS